ncbi:2-oxoacid:acceptor oxidoreductase subunit alpha [Candidatus Karelsulcia muelleri]|uniref:2-oxoacid:acceptor oxidoreductase subunit alpha n=1 Tax=Candidatus Karelsulcia muelleri TaxID=336810 RepID=A0A3A1MLH3_9FLAO|nr:2-oxoacid:acceptor oxidoreductase subunit alpha [Candidatus Karelsulcia muelleri]RIU86185.1 2-oxoacid:acceptor oxidoreductase subunit alpha [Candidatus Karelsulcia muelleri]
MTSLLNDVIILFAGNSGDGIQFLGKKLSDTCTSSGNYISTLSDFTAEIRAGFSGFKIHISNKHISYTGEKYDVLVVMNAFLLKKNLNKLKVGGIIIADISGFNKKQLKLAGYLENSLKKYKVFCLKISSYLYKIKININNKKCFLFKNMFVLGFLCWLYNFSIKKNVFLSKKENILKYNLKILKFGYFFGKKKCFYTEKFRIFYYKKKSGRYRNINGNEGISLGMIAACKKANINMFYSWYPITPASAIFNNISKYGIKTFQAEDEISAITSAIGASYSGNLGVTGTSGPGMSLKQEGLGLCFMLELPLVVINVQRAGPSTGLPTKTEQSDLMQAFYGRHGECPIPILASKSPSNCFYISFIACKIAIEYMTPVIILSDGYLANSYETWKLPKGKDLNKIKVNYNYKNNKLPYERNKNGIRFWVPPGNIGYENIIGGLEKENLTGNVSSEEENHEFMVKNRHKKINKIKKYLPFKKINIGKKKGKLLILSWGSTYGCITEAVKKLIIKGYSVSSMHIEYIYPFPNGIKDIIYNFEKIMIPEINNGQLSNIIRDKFLIYPIALNKIKGITFTVSDIINKVYQVL